MREAEFPFDSVFQFGFDLFSNVVRASPETMKPRHDVNHTVGYKYLIDATDVTVLCFSFVIVYYNENWCKQWMYSITQLEELKKISAFFFLYFLLD